LNVTQSVLRSMGCSPHPPEPREAEEIALSFFHLYCAATDHCECDTPTMPLDPSIPGENPGLPPGVPTKFPNKGCLVSESTDCGSVHCHSRWDGFCPFVVQLGSLSWCTHPEVTTLPKMK